MASEKLSARQLDVAVMVGGLSLSAAVAGQVDWRWALAFLPLGLALGWLVLRRVGDGGLGLTRRGRLLTLAYRAWAVVLLADTLGRAAARLSLEGGGTIWPLLLLTLPLLWMGWGKRAPFFRAVEILWLAVAALLAAVVVLAAPKVEWRYLWQPVGDWAQSLAGLWQPLAVGLFALPQLSRVERQPGDLGRGLGWLAALGVATAVLAAATAGVLSPALAGAVEEPFFQMTGLLGDSARLEGLISALWLLPDLTLAGLLSRSWGEGRWPALAVAAGALLALTGVTAPVWGTAILVTLTVILPEKGGNNSGGEIP